MTAPKQPHDKSPAKLSARIVAELCRLIDACPSNPTIAELAAQAGWSESHLHRTFKQITGLTPKAYRKAKRAERLKAALDQSASVTDAVFASGHESTSRFHQDATEFLGMTPTQFRSGGANSQVHFAIGQCSLGAILVAMSPRGVVAITLGDNPAPLIEDFQERYPAASLIAGDAAFESHIATIIAYVEAPTLGLDLPLDIQGTAFQLRVWQALQQIPIGATRTYSEIAIAIGAPKSARAVARACASNKIALAIPCHRVIRQDGGISGYRWGVERKRAILTREASSHPRTDAT